eukprot:Skav235791  [mRNA]  locus=scaffold1267:41757:42596:+ [translate_table: standard]
MQMEVASSAKQEFVATVQFNVLSRTWTTLSTQSEDAVVVSAAKPTAAPPAEWPQPRRFMRNNLEKQSGVPQVYWNKAMVAWRVHYPTFDSKGKKSRTFSVKKFLVPGRSESEADAAALEAAKAFRAELVQQGILSEPKPRDPDFTSEVPGVKWHKPTQKWQVEICQKGGQKRIYGGLVTEKAAAEVKALKIREQQSLQRQVKPVSTLAELQWLAQCKVGGTTPRFRIRPKDHSQQKPKDHSQQKLERTFKEAVVWKKKEKERAKAKRPKARRVKRQQHK